jgi:homocysteine S-methyltransferase
LPSGGKISDLKDVIDEQVLGVMLSCVSPENFEINLNELKDLNVPFGFKLNGFVTTKPKDGYTTTFLKTKANPNEFLGKRKDLTPYKISEIAKKFRDNGATIIGGCCETRHSHIEEMAKLK